MDRTAAVLFDWGGVLIDDPVSGLMAYCASALNVPVADYIEAHARAGAAFQRGQIPEEVFWRRVCADLARPEPAGPSLWGRAFRAAYAPRAAVFALARRLREAGCKTGLVSNTEAAAMQFFIGLQYDMFDALVFSCAEGLCKPEQAIYETAAAKLGIAARNCAFIDDNPAFVAGANAAGMKGVLYGDLAQVEADLADLGVMRSDESGSEAM